MPVNKKAGTMQKNDFEKNVQNRMDELQLYPSAEVWPEVERRIRKEKKRRWFIFWFLFLALLTGGGMAVYYLNNGSKKNLSAAQEQQLKNIPAGDNKEINNETQNSVPGDSKPVFSTGEQNRTDINGNTDAVTNSPEVVRNKTAIRRNERPSVSFESGNAKRNKTIKPAKAAGDPVATVITETSKPFDNKPEKHEPVAVLETKQSEDSAAVVKTNAVAVAELQGIKNEDKKTEPSKPAVSNMDSAGYEKPAAVAKKKQNKWQLGLTISAGLSNRAGELGFINSEKSLASLSVTPGGPPPAMQAFYPANSNSGLSWELGIYTKRNLKKKNSLSLELSVSSFAVRQPVGAFFDSVSAQASSISPEFYRAGNFNIHSSRYYFLQAPLMFHWQLNKENKPPLVWENGFSPSLLLGSNAIIYNSSASIFYKDNSAINKFQLSFRTGLYRQFADKSGKPFSAGLFLNYQLSGLQNTYAFDKNHLLSFGIQVKKIFQYY